MAIKIGNNTTVFKVGSGDCTIYLGNTLLYSPTPSYKWLATYTTGTTSAECDGTSAITSREVATTNLVAVSIGDCVTRIDYGAFQYCTSLSSCTIGNSVTTIGEGTFQYCFKLSSVTIGSGVTSIDREAFYYSYNLSSVTITATTPPTLGDSVFDNTNNCPIYVPAQSVSAYQSAWSDYASRIQAIS